MKQFCYFSLILIVFISCKTELKETAQEIEPIVFEDIDALDQGVQDLVDYLLSKNPEAQSMLKKVFWEGCENWDELLAERAAMSGRLVLSEYTKKVLASYA